MRQSSDKLSANILASLLEEYGVRDVVVSPGSRNAPLITACDAMEGLRLYPVIDERMAAFMALGLGISTRKPVVLICTSGSAVLNYAPAVAEAYYENIPLIVISADRPAEWIDQQDSQTIRQSGVLRNIVKRSYDIADIKQGDNTGEWYAWRIINEALTTAVNGCKGPVHINIQFDNPLGGMSEHISAKRVRILSPTESVESGVLTELADEASRKRVMVVCGSMLPSSLLNRALGRLSAKRNVAVLTEATANLHIPDIVNHIDLTLASAADDILEQLRPELIIHIGGGLISKRLKKYLRTSHADVWYVGKNDGIIDTYQNLTMTVAMSPEVFMAALVHKMHRFEQSGEYHQLWCAVQDLALRRRDQCLATLEWCDLKAYSAIMQALPSEYNLHISNGSPIRYVQYFDCARFHTFHCNRGVSGIDGSTTTALGASLANKSTTLLITGDMSLAYDIAPLLSNYSSSFLKIIVIRNGGGGIFRIIGSTAENPGLEKYFASDPDIDFTTVARRFAVWQASDLIGLHEVLPEFIAENERPALLEIVTSGTESARALRRFIDIEIRN